MGIAMEMGHADGGNRNMGQCQAAVAEAVEVFGRLDILFCCSSEGMFGMNNLWMGIWALG